MLLIYSMHIAIHVCVCVCVSVCACVYVYTHIYIIYYIYIYMEIKLYFVSTVYHQTYRCSGGSRGFIGFHGNPLFKSDKLLATFM